MSDPVIRSLASILRSGDYEKIADVPVFDIHKEYDREGNLVREVTLEDLEEIALTMNLREEAKGDLGAFGPGHRLKGEYAADGRLVKPAKETEQPPLWGFLTNWKIVPSGPRGEMKLCPDFYVRRDHLAEFKSYPWRSPEVWHRAKMIDWVALLRRTPQLDLGTLALPQSEESNLVPRYLTPNAQAPAAIYERVRGGLIYYQMTEANMPGDALPAPETPIGTAAPVMEPPAAGIAAEETPEHMMAKCYAALTKYGGMWEKHYQAYQAEAPAATNTFIPSDKSEKEKVAAETEKETERKEENMHAAQRAGEPWQYAKVERDLADTRKELQAVRTLLDTQRSDYQAKERLTWLRAMRQERQFNLAQAEKDMVPLAEPQWQMYQRFIVENCPAEYTAGPQLAIYNRPVEGPERAQPTTAQERDEAVSLATRTGKPFDDCLKEVRKGKAV